MNVATIVFQRSKPNESKSWSRDGVSGDNGVSNIDELIKLWFDIFKIFNSSKREEEINS